jgi:hypothetical protein
MYNEKTCKKDYKRSSCFRKWEASRSKEKEKRADKTEKDLRWKEVSTAVRERDGYSCRLAEILSSEEIHQSGYLTWPKDQCECAHVIRRSQSLTLYYETKNIVLLHKHFHERLDQYKNPITGKSITKEEADTWWARIVGAEEFLWLIENK